MLNRCRLLMATAVSLTSSVATAGDRPAAGVGAAQQGIGPGTVLELMLGLAAVLGAIAFTAWLARRALQFRPSMNAQIRVLGGLPVGGRERVVLVQVGGTQMVLGVAPGRVQTLYVLDQPLCETAVADRAERGAKPPDFADVLRRLVGGRGQGA